MGAGPPGRGAPGRPGCPGRPGWPGLRGPPGGWPGRAVRARRGRLACAGLRGLAGRIGSVDGLGQPEPENRARYVDQGADAQHPGGAAQDLDAAGQHDAQGRGDERYQRGPRVRGHQGELGGQQPGRHRAAHHPVGLLQDQHAECGRKQRQRIVQGRGHPPAQQAPGEQRAGHDVAASLLNPVQHRPDERREHHERRHRDEQVENHLAARLVERGVEEQRPGQRHDHEGVPDVARRGQLDQVREAGAARAGGTGDPVEEPARAARRAGAGPRGTGSRGGARPGGRLRGGEHLARSPPGLLGPRARLAHDTSILPRRVSHDPAARPEPPVRVSRRGHAA